MPSIRDSLDRIGHARLQRFLERSTSRMFTGQLRVSGRPGGCLSLRQGLVVAVASPGAPGVQALLVRTGRVTDDEWMRAGGVEGRAATGAIGSAHLHVIRVMAAQDALFAMLAGTIDACSFEDGPLTEEGEAEDAERLLLTAFEKLDALASLPQAILPHRERLVPVLSRSAGEAGQESGHPALTAATRDPASVRADILRYADGRRTARDIAFLCGRRLYPVTVEMSRMLGEGILREAPQSQSAGPAEDLSQRLLPRSRVRQSPDEEPKVSRPDLPRRQPPAPGDTADTETQKSPTSWRDFLRLGGRTGEDRSLSARRKGTRADEPPRSCRRNARPAGTRTGGNRHAGRGLRRPARGGRA